MARHPEPEEKSAAPHSKRLSEAQEEAEEGAPSHSHPLLKQVAHYAGLSIGPLLAILALAFALIAINRVGPVQTKLDEAEARIKKLGAELASTQLELKKAKDAVQQEKTARDEENKKQDELASKIIENVVPLQKKLKISPTLEEQLRQSESASAVQPTASNATAPQKTEKQHSPQVKAMLEEIKKFNEQ